LSQCDFKKGSTGFQASDCGLAPSGAMNTRRLGDKYALIRSINTSCQINSLVHTNRNINKSLITMTYKS
jgi:hypothetical protein